MATVPIHNPVMPFLGLIPGGMRNGVVLKIRGQILGFSNRFQINIQQGPALKPRDDVMLHLSVRPQENAIIRSHMINQQFGAEERHGGYPIQSNDSFEITIVAETAFFKILVNGQHFCTFNHRLSMHLAKYISISGTGNIHYILMENDVNHGANQIYPNLPTAPSFPIQQIPPMHQCPIPPPMPPPPPYPGFYPSQPNYPAATPYRKPLGSTEKMAAGLGVAVGLSVSAISKALINVKKTKKK